MTTTPEANDLSHLSDEEFNALCPQGEHAPGPEPLSPAAERCQVRGVIEAAMAENKAVWADFAPNEGSLFSYDPESETARTWEHRMRNVILPNHFRIQSVIKANLDLLTEAEREVFGQYQEHVRCLVERHICGISGGMIRYPAAMHGILK